ncbi:GntR family transcriptional regulator [Salinisphaera sp. USBA-960]|uniref:GntR family transcriptional regulator n=1 Tax=Salinisphaera orenii TaxID=856731 RepID=UPI000DBE4945|nr:GntR family transcriptional regulator [Salifodinibacter halophilus]NNC26523.1 GntR family transcriptional regulator [Salifodinibacter halophilus]
MANTPQATNTAHQSRKTSQTIDAENRIYDSIRHAVLVQKLHPGTRLPELTLSEIYGINRSIVRRALVRLDNDRIIVMRRNQSAMVANPTPEEIAQLFAARRHIEAQVMRETAGQLREHQRQHLETILDNEHTAHEAQHHDDRIHLSLDFHQHLADACPNQVLGRILRDLILQTSIAVALYKVPGLAACYRAADHRGIADAVFNGDDETAARLACEHLDYLENRLNYTQQTRNADLQTVLGAAPHDAAAHDTAT